MHLIIATGCISSARYRLVFLQTSRLSNFYGRGGCHALVHIVNAIFYLRNKTIAFVVGRGLGCDSVLTNEKALLCYIEFVRTTAISLLDVA